MITILTPSYNRGYIIKKAYDSLVRQEDKDFEWLIVDDGSTDDTKKIVDGFIKENKIKIRYYYKKNGGKHTALNYGIKRLKGDLVLILDSDDYLTDDAVKKIKFFWNKYCDNEKICGLSFLRELKNRKTIAKKYEGTEIISNHITFRYNKGLLGDMAEVFRADVIKKYPFPVYDGERFLSEAIVWNRIAFDYDTVYINEPIYVCEYLEDGLSNSCLNSRIKCPVGSLENSKVFMDKRFKLSIRIKNAILYIGFSLIAKRKIKQIIKESNHSLLTVLVLPLGFLFYLYLKSRNIK